MVYKEIGFDEASHTYSDGTNKKYTSVTTFIGMYKPKYDTDFWSMYTALKDRHYKVLPDPQKHIIRISGVPYKLKDLKKDKLMSAYQEQTLAEWKVITEVACAKGTAVHNKLEDNINTSNTNYTKDTNENINPFRNMKINNIHDLDKTDLQQKYPLIYNRFKFYVEKGANIYAEKRVHLEDYLIAGMIDVPIIKGTQFCIDDWKTNKDEIHQTAGYYKKVKVGGKFVKSDTWITNGERMCYPIDHLENCSFVHYALQLSMYAYIMEVWGYKLVNNGLNIIHIRDNKEPQVITLPYLKKEVMMMLEHYKMGA